MSRMPPLEPRFPALARAAFYARDTAMNPIDTVLDRLVPFKLRENGQGRWRACCPAHGGRNPTALSVGVGAEDQVLLRCWHGCEVEQIAQSIGLDLQDL